MSDPNDAHIDNWVHDTFGKHPNDYETQAGGTPRVMPVSNIVSPPASGLVPVANPYAGTDLDFAWEAGFKDGSAEPDEHPEPPSPYGDQARIVYAEGLLAGQENARGLPNRSEAPMLPPTQDAPSPDSHIIQILKRAAAKVGGAAGEKLLELAKPASVATMLAFMGLFVAAQWTPAGWAADGILVVTLVASAALVGREISGVIDDIRSFVRLANSPNGDVEEASDHLARAVASVGVDVILAILLHKAASAAKPYIKPPSGFVDLVTPDGQIVRVPAGAVPETPMATTGGAGEPSDPPTNPVPKRALVGEPPDPAGYSDAVAKGDMATAAHKLGTLDANAKLDNLGKLKPDQLAELHDAVVKQQGPDSPDARMSDPAHRANLELDPDVGKPRPNERDTGLRAEQKLNTRLQRYKPEAGKKGDWIDENGTVYDGCSPPKSQFFDAQMKLGNYETSLRGHVNNPNVNVVVIDISNLGLTAEQLGVLDGLVAKYGAIKPILRLP